MRVSFLPLGIVGLAVAALVMLPAPLNAQLKIAARGARPAGTIPLPYTSADGAGNQWMIYQQGWFRQQGNMPLYSQAAMMTINGNGANNAANQARIDEKTGEVVIENINFNGVMVTRRIFIDKQNNFIRYIDILKSSAAQEMSANVVWNTNFNYGTQMSQPINDPRAKDKPIGYAIALQAGRSIYEMYATRGSKVVPQMSVPEGNNLLQTSQQVTIPAGKQVALFHVHGVAATVEAATQTCTGLKDSQIFAQVPLEIRKLLVNAPNLQTIGDREVLRGELFDVLELRSGDQIKGTLAEKSYKLKTFYGPIELPAERVVGLINAGQFRPRQLLVTVDGEVFGGSLEKETIGMTLSSGQATQVPLSQITRFGYRKRNGEPEEWTFDRAMVSLRSGERMLVAMPTTTIDVMTQYGLLKLKPEAIAAINFQPEDRGGHEVELIDGSKFSALAMAETFPLQLVGTASQQSVSFPSAMVARLQLTKLPDGVPDGTPSLQLINQDVLAGTVAGQLKLDTNFDTITVNGSELLSLTHAPEAGLDVQVSLWDQTTLSGQLREAQITCTLKSGVAVTVPVPLISRYDNPLPRPSETMVERIKAVMKDLSAEDWRQRERAEQQLVAMGTSVIPVLKDLREGQPLEAQQRIDSILKSLDTKSATPAPGVSPEMLNKP